MTHCTSTIVAFRFVCSAGNATFTTVPSMKAMLDARVVAARTQCPANFEQGAAAGRERIMLSSHGSWRTGNIRRFRQPSYWHERQRILLKALFRRFRRQCFDDRDVWQQLRWQLVPRLQIDGTVVRDQNFSQNVFPDQNLERKIDRAAGRRQHHWSATFWVAKN